MTDQAIEAGEHIAAEPTTEDRAREMGWRPKEEFKGDEARWVDAESFVKKGEEVLPIVNARAKKLEAANEAMKAELADMKKTFGEFKQYHSKTETRAYERAMRDLETRQAEAVEANDLTEVRKITKEMTDLSKDVRTDDQGDPYATPDHAKALSQFQADNAWFMSDPVMTASANVIANQLESAGVKGAEQLQEVAKRIRAEFPHRFENERRKAPATVEGTSPPRKGGKTLSDLPPEARAQAIKWDKAGLVSTAQFLKDYQW